MTVFVEIRTELGSFKVAVHEECAPATASNFLRYVDGGFVEQMSAYRILSAANQPLATPHRVEVIQWGWRPHSMEVVQPFPYIIHEPTSLTGLRHRHLTVSMARDEPGTAGPEFFICIGDQPELDEGGRRNIDLAGFAAFGHVVDGEHTISAMFACAEVSEHIHHPIRFLGAQRV